MGYCKKDVTPLLTHWSYIFLARTYRCFHCPCMHIAQPCILFESIPIFPGPISLCDLWDSRTFHLPSVTSPAQGLSDQQNFHWVPKFTEIHMLIVSFKSVQTHMQNVIMIGYDISNLSDDNFLGIGNSILIYQVRSLQRTHFTEYCSLGWQYDMPQNELCIFVM